MSRGGATAATDHLHAEVLNEVHELHLQLNRGQAVVGHATDVFRKACIWNAAHGKWRVLREIANVLLHLLRPRRAVESENVDGKGLEYRDHRCNIGTDEHGARGFHGHRHHQGPSFTRCFKCLFNTLQCRFDLQNVLTGLNNQEIDVASDQAFGLLPEGGSHRVEIDVAEGGQFGGGPHGPSHKTRFFRGAEFISNLTSQLSRLLVQLKSLIFESVLHQHDRCGTERVCFDDIATNLEKLAVHRLDRFGAGDHQILVAAFQLSTTEIIGVEI